MDIKRIGLVCLVSSLLSIVGYITLLAAADMVAKGYGLVVYLSIFVVLVCILSAVSKE